MVRIGIDPSLNQTGWAVADKEQITASGVIKTQGGSIPEKLWRLRTVLMTLLLSHNPDQAIIEIQDSFGSYFKRQNRLTGKGLNQSALNKQNWGIGALLACLYEYYALSKRHDCIEMLTTTQWKGRMQKGQAKLLASNICKREIKNDNEAEAILLALKGHYYAR